MWQLTECTEVLPLELCFCLCYFTANYVSQHFKIRRCHSDKILKTAPSSSFISAKRFSPFCVPSLRKYLDHQSIQLVPFIKRNTSTTQIPVPLSQYDMMLENGWLVSYVDTKEYLLILLTVCECGVQTVCKQFLPEFANNVCRCVLSLTVSEMFKIHMSLQWLSS